MKYFLILFTVVALLATSTIEAKDDNMRIGGDVGIGIPTGNMADVVNIGFGLSGSFHYYLQPNLILGGTLGYYTFGGKEIGFNFTGSKYKGPNLNIIPIMALINYNFGTTGMIPFIGAELGLTNFGASWEDGSDSDIYFGFNILGGIEQSINENLSWRATAKYNIITSEGSSTSYLSITGGVYFKL